MGDEAHEQRVGHEVGLEDVLGQARQFKRRSCGNGPECLIQLGQVRVASTGMTRICEPSCVITVPPDGAVNEARSPTPWSVGALAHQLLGSASGREWAGSV
jgi:hypothetical protein